MTYRSTRRSGAPESFETALLRGLAPDGGLYVPVQIPAVSPAAWIDAGDIRELGTAVLEEWIGDEVPIDALEPIVHDALSFEVPVVPLDSGDWKGVQVLELFHGPTLSFKDFGARTMARLMEYFMRARGERLTILVATSGDTGSAVADGFAGQDQIDVVLLYPKGQVSPVQERQLVARRPGVRTFAVEGTFDDCQRMVKAAFTDPELEDASLSSANSINIGRLLPQMLYYLWAVRVGEFDEPVICVPSGNLGNLTGGMLAALSGLPVHRFIAAHNANDFFPKFLAGRPAHFEASVQTYSNAMDVGAPSNFERLRALMSEEDLRRRVHGERVTDEETLVSMRRVYDETGYLADPHTAVGLEAARRYRADVDGERPLVVLSTAHPAKFPEVVEEALGIVPQVPERLAALWHGETAVSPLPPEVGALKETIVAA